MKKLAAFLLCFAVTLSLAACGNTASPSLPSSAPTSLAPSASSPAQPSSAEPETEQPSQSGTDSSRQPEGASGAGTTLVVYFSATGNTQQAAAYIAQLTGGDLFALEPVDPYTAEDLSYNDPDSRVARERADESMQKVELVQTTVAHWDSYDTVFLGYPIWWGQAAWPVNTFVEANDFTGKTVIPFCTSSSSGLGDSGEALAELAGTGDWQEGMRFSSGVSDEEVAAWVESLEQ